MNTISKESNLRETPFSLNDFCSQNFKPGCSKTFFRRGLNIGTSLVLVVTDEKNHLPEIQRKH